MIAHLFVFGAAVTGRDDFLWHAIEVAAPVWDNTVLDFVTSPPLPRFPMMLCFSTRSLIGTSDGRMQDRHRKARNHATDLSDPIPPVRSRGAAAR
jgi:hypothetical protein